MAKQVSLIRMRHTLEKKRGNGGVHNMPGVSKAGGPTKSPQLHRVTLEPGFVQARRVGRREDER